MSIESIGKQVGDSIAAHVAGYLTGLVVALIIGAAIWLHHSGYESGLADGKAELGKADDANVACVGTISALKLSIAQCETNRLLDQNAQLKASAARDKQQVASDKNFAALHHQLEQAMTNECADWAKQPACGSVQ